MDFLKRAAASVSREAFRFDPRRHIPTALGGFTPANMAAMSQGGPLDLLGRINPRLHLPTVLGGHTPAQVLEPHHAGVYTAAQRTTAYLALNGPGGVTGGPGSLEEGRVAHTFGVLPQRRNSFAESTLIHSANPSGPPGTMTPADFEGLRAAGAINHGALMAALPAGTPERPWVPIFGGRSFDDSIRTGRIFDPVMADGSAMTVRIHSNDPYQDLTQHAGAGPIVRFEHGKQALLDAPLTTNSATDTRLRKVPLNWGKGGSFPNQTHIPLI